MALAVVACSSQNGSSGDSGVGADGESPADASTDDASGPGSDATHRPDSDASQAACVPPENDAGTCTSITPTGPMVLATCLSSEPPAVQGGTIEDGTYLLDSFTYYGSCPAMPDLGSTTWVICGDHWDVAQLEANTASPDAGFLPLLRLDYLTTVQGATVTFTSSCTPAGASPFPLPPRGYTATPGRLTFVYPNPNNNPGSYLVSTYTRQ